MIKLNPDGLQIMKRQNAAKKSVPFSIVFVKADKARGTAGEIVHLERVFLSDSKRSGSIENRWINIRPINTFDYIKVHLDLILYINGHPIA